MKKYFYLFCLCGLFAGLFGSCGDDVYETYIISPTPSSGLTITTFNGGNYTMELTDSIMFKAELSNRSEAATFSWVLDTTEVSTDSIYVFKTNRSGLYTLQLTATDTSGSFTQTANITVNPGKYKHGTFILNEGLIATHGSLIYISPSGEITPNVYHAVNGKYLWGLTQDMFIRHNKIYIIAQKGDDISRNDGGLTILNAETLKEEFSYSFLTGELNQPTHIAVLGEDEIYIREAGASVPQGQIKVFHPSDSTIQKIEGSEEARHNTLAVANNKIFTAHHSEPVIMVIEQGATSVSHRIQWNDLVSGIIRSSDGKLWVSDNSGTISKLDPDTYEIIDSHTLTGNAATLLARNPESSKTASPQITAKGDTLYINRTGSTIYCHAFGLNATIEMVDATYYIPEPDDYFQATNFQAYNTCAVDPVTGEVYLNTLEGWGGSRHRNHISVFDFSWQASRRPGSYNITVRLARDYANYLDYPANVYFTHNFLELEKAEEAFINQ